jgi:hypothetical protein
VSYSLSRDYINQGRPWPSVPRPVKEMADMVGLTEQIGAPPPAAGMMFPDAVCLAGFERNLVTERTTNALYKEARRRSIATRHPTALKPSRAAWSRSNGKPRSWPRFKRRGQWQHPANHCRQALNRRSIPKTSRPGHRPPFTCC